MGQPKPDCPQCGGSGAYYGTSPVCCGRPDHRGDCCGDPEPEVVQCQCESTPDTAPHARQLAEQRDAHAGNFRNNDNQNDGA